MAKKKVSPKKSRRKAVVFKVLLIGERLFSTEKEAKKLHDKYCFGEISRDEIHYSIVEGLYLLEKRKIKIYEGKKLVGFDSFLKKAGKIEPKFYTRFIVFSDMRDKGYVVKTALKFGADFRVYAKGIKPGKEHAKWILYPVQEGSTLTWHEFAAKNRVAHSTKKKILIGAVDDEEDVTYWEISWEKP